MKKSLSLALAIACFSSLAIAEDGFNFNVGLHLGTDAYDNSAMKGDGGDKSLARYALAQAGYIKSKTDFFNNLTYGVSAKAYYTMDDIRFYADAAYRLGKIDTQVQNMSRETDSNDYFTFKDASFNEFKTKANIGYSFNIDTNASITPSIGLGYWSSSLTHSKDNYAIDADNTNGEGDGANKLDTSTKATTIPFGLSLKSQLGDDFGINLSMYYHYLFDAKTKATRGINDTGAKIIADGATLEYKHSSSSNLTSNYAMQFDVALNYKLSSETGIDSIGVGFFWDKINLVKSNTLVASAVKYRTGGGSPGREADQNTTYGPANDAQYGAYIEVGF